MDLIFYDNQRHLLFEAAMAGGGEAACGEATPRQAARWQRQSSLHIHSRVQARLADLWEAGWGYKADRRDAKWERRSHAQERQRQLHQDGLPPTPAAPPQPLLEQQQLQQHEWAEQHQPQHGPLQQQEEELSTPPQTGEEVGDNMTRFLT